MAISSEIVGRVGEPIVQSVDARWTMAYAASKSAALSLTKSIALSCAENKYPIRCNAVLPGVVMTPMIEKLLEESPDADALLAGFVAAHPLGRLVEGVEVALLFRSTSRGKVKVSFRSSGDADVNRLAGQFGGGGHVKASGALIAGELSEVVSRVVLAADGALPMKP